MISDKKNGYCHFLQNRNWLLNHFSFSVTVHKCKTTSVTVSARNQFKNNHSSMECGSIITSHLISCNIKKKKQLLLVWFLFYHVIQEKAYILSNNIYPLYQDMLDTVQTIKFGNMISFLKIRFKYFVCHNSYFSKQCTICFHSEYVFIGAKATCSLMSASIIRHHVTGHDTVRQMPPNSIWQLWSWHGWGTACMCLHMLAKK